jgi:hypothetical protein
MGKRGYFEIVGLLLPQVRLSVSEFTEGFVVCDWLRLVFKKTPIFGGFSQYFCAGVVNFEYKNWRQLY